MAKKRAAPVVRDEDVQWVIVVEETPTGGYYVKAPEAQRRKPSTKERRIVATYLFKTPVALTYRAATVISSVNLTLPIGNQDTPAATLKALAKKRLGRKDVRPVLVGFAKHFKITLTPPPKTPPMPKGEKKQKPAH